MFDCSEMTPGLVWPTHIESVQFPVQGAGGKSPVSGVILRAPAADAPYQWSEEYLDDWYIGSFSRGWVAQVHLGGDGTTLPELPNWYDHDRTAPDDYAQVLEDGRIDVGVPARSPRMRAGAFWHVGRGRCANRRVQSLPARPGGM